MRHTKDEVLERVRREFQLLDHLVAGFADADWARPVPRPETRAPWTVKDALVHIAYWKRHTARGFRRGKRPAELRGMDVNDVNAWLYEQWRARSPADVLAWHREAHQDVLRTLEALPAEWFGRREFAAPWPYDLDGHSAEHRRKDIEAALEKV
jgi:hypothetical protein